MADEEKIIIDYTNHVGARQVREITPDSAGLFFSSSEWHPEPQWLLNAFDHGKQAPRTFAMSMIHRWGVEPGRQMDIDLSLAAQLQRSMELNARMKRRLLALGATTAHWPAAISAIEAILRDEDPT